MRRPASLRIAHRQSGAGMVETMIGILIGLLVVLVVYNMISVSEGYRRMTSGNADAQITGLISQFISANDAANGGNGITSAYNDLINCHQDESGTLYTADTTLKPISVLVTAGALATDSDSFVSRQSASTHVVWPVAVRSVPEVVAGAGITVQSPNGFSTPAKVSLPTPANPYWVVAIANDGTGTCGLIQVVNSTASDDITGEVTLTQGAPATTIPYKGIPINDTGTGAFMLNLGRVNGGGAARVRYDVANNQLRTTNCMFADGCANAAAVPNPVAQNVVWMKVQYGIDQSAPNPDGTLAGRVDCWTPADATGGWDGTCTLPGAPDLLPATIASAGFPIGAPVVPTNVLNRIVAIRIGLVVRSDEPDLKNVQLYTPPAQINDPVTGALVTGTRQQEFLFNCPANTNAGCPNRVAIPRGAAAPNIMLDGWRYRTYEAVVPLRNSIFNATIPPPT